MSYEIAQVRLLIKTGCFDRIAGEVTRPGLLWRLHAQGKPVSLAERHTFRPYLLMLSQFTLYASPSLPIPIDYSQTQKIQHEIELFGFPLSVHPLELFASSFDARQCVPACEMPQYVGKKDYDGRLAHY